MKKVIALIMVFTILLGFMPKSNVYAVSLTDLLKNEITIDVKLGDKIKDLLNKSEDYFREKIGRFTDLGKHWADITVGKLVELGVIDGYKDGTFKPNNTITRAEFAKLIRNSLKLNLVEGNSFEDTNKHWAKDEINTLVVNNIIVKSEYGTNYSPDINITRVEMAKMVVRALGMENEAKAKNSGNSNFADNNQIKSADRGYIIVASEIGIITGYPDNTFRPNQTATRAEASKMIVNMIDPSQRLINKETPKEVPKDNITIEEELEELKDAINSPNFNQSTYSKEQRAEKEKKMAEYSYSGNKSAFPEPIIKVQHVVNTSSTLFNLYLENRNEYGSHFTYKTEVISDSRLNRYESVDGNGKWFVTRQDIARSWDHIGKPGILWNINMYAYAMQSEQANFKLYDGMKISLKTTITNTYTKESKSYITDTEVQTLKLK